MDFRSRQQLKRALEPLKLGLGILPPLSSPSRERAYRVRRDLEPARTEARASPGPTEK